VRKRLRFRCKHRHDGISHRQCFEESHPAERIGFLDIEATSLNASFGYMLTYCIKRRGGDILERSVKPSDIRGKRYDKGLCEQFLRDLDEFDRFVTYYGTGYDLPFLRTRCLTHDLVFPPMGSLFHTDLYYSVRNKLKLYRNRMEVACDQFGIESKGHRLNPPVWMAAQAGDPEAIDWVLTHNREDVISLEALYDKMGGHFKLNKTSV